jgi:hypothetical protein
VNDSVVSIKVQGGIGNMMFQTAFALAYSMVKNCKYEILDYDINLLFNKHAKNRMNSDYYKQNIFSRIDFSIKNATKTIFHPEIPFEYSEIPFESGCKNIYLGYFQSEKYFYEFSDQVKSYFYANAQTVSDIKKIGFDFNNSIALHVRRGDFLQLSASHPPIDLEYINQSINYFGKKKNFLIVSDDVNWCKNNINLPNAMFLENHPDYFDFYAMSFCEHNIISNSTFSWWAAWLNKNAEKKVICPKIWFGKDYNHLNEKDLILKNWVRL